MTDDKRKKIIEKIQLLFNRAERAIRDAEDPEKVDHEAQTALETARNLMNKYGLEMEDIESVDRVGDPRPGADASGITVEFRAQKVDKWVLSLAIVIADYFNVKVFYHEGNIARLVYYGVALNSEIAAYAFQSVFNQVRELSRKYKVNRSTWDQSKKLGGLFRRLSVEYDIPISDYGTFEGYRAAAKREYREGLVIGFAERLKKMKEKESQSSEGERITALAIRYDEIAAAWLVDNSIRVEEKKSRRSNKGTGIEHRYHGMQDSKDLHLGKGLGPKKS